MVVALSSVGGWLWLWCFEVVVVAFRLGLDPWTDYPWRFQRGPRNGRTAVFTVPGYTCSAPDPKVRETGCTGILSDLERVLPSRHPGAFSAGSTLETPTRLRRGRKGYTVQGCMEHASLRAWFHWAVLQHRHLSFYNPKTIYAAKA